MDDFDLKNGFVTHRDLSDGRLLAVVPMTFGKYRLTIGTGIYGYDSGY